MGGGENVLFIVEGARTEVEWIKRMSGVFFHGDDPSVFVLPMRGNIYMLWNELQRYNGEADVIEVLKKTFPTEAEGFAGLDRNRLDQVFLFFDYDIQNANLPGGVRVDDVLPGMLRTFSNETELGKLYVSYPMIEAVRDWTDDGCETRTECVLSMDEIRDYKRLSGEGNPHADVRKYDKETWCGEIVNFAIRLGCLFGTDRALDFRRYRDEVTPEVVYGRERLFAGSDKAFVLSSIPEFLLDYFREDFWDDVLGSSGVNARYENCMTRRNR